MTSTPCRSLRTFLQGSPPGRFAGGKVLQHPFKGFLRIPQEVINTDQPGRTERTGPQLCLEVDMKKDEFGQAEEPSDLVLDVVGILEEQASILDRTWLAMATAIVEYLETI